MLTRPRFAAHYFMLFAVMAAVGPYFSLLLRDCGFDESQIGLLVGLRGGAAAFGPLLIGYLADRFGRRRAMLTACLLAFGLLMLPLPAVGGFRVPLLQGIADGTIDKASVAVQLAGSLWVAAALMLGMGLVARTSVPLTDALAANELGDAARDYGRVRVWGSIGFVVVLAANAAFGFVNEDSAWSIITCVMVMLLLCLVTTQLLPDSHRHGRHEQAPLGSWGFDLGFWLFIAAAACHQVGMTAHYVFFSLYLKDVLHMETAAWVWAVAAIAEIPLMMFAGPIIKRVGIRPVLVAALLGVSFRLCIYALAPGLWPVLSVQLLHGMTFALWHAAGIELIRRKVAPTRRGLAMTIYVSVPAALPGLLRSWLGGHIILHWGREAIFHGYRVLYLGYAVGPLVGVALILLAGKRLLKVRAE